MTVSKCIRSKLSAPQKRFMISHRFLIYIVYIITIRYTLDMHNSHERQSQHLVVRYVHFFFFYAHLHIYILTGKGGKNQSLNCDENLLYDIIFLCSSCLKAFGFNVFIRIGKTHSRSRCEL